MFIARTPKIVEKYYSELEWRIETETKEVFLTFDDGPTPGVTEWVLEELDRFNAKGTFFCLGKNVKANFGLFERILAEGHAVGNHTFDHRRGWKSKKRDYLKSVIRCAEWVDSDLFRPPYGRVKKGQIRALRAKYRIIMWDVLSGDYSRAISPEQCLNNVISRATPGSIVVFHDSEKAEKNLKFALTGALKYFTGKGYTLSTIK